MKKRIKKNNRTKALAGIDDAAIIGLIGSLIAAGGTIAGSAINAENQKQIEEAKRKAQLFANNESNAQSALANQTEALNYNQNEEILTSKTGSLSTLNSNFCFGGKRRMKRAGGTVTSDINKFGLYI